jgi:predicted dehydrogenase
MTRALRIGVLGAARIVPQALCKPAAVVDDVEIVAVAARDPARAQAFARKHHIARVHTSYADLVNDPDVDAIYNPLPNGLHGVWSMRALQAGKHVLCEKPLAANADEAHTMGEVARASGRVLMEAFHWRHHPLAARMIDVVTSGVLGPIQSVTSAMCVPLPIPGDIRYRRDLAGGALMDVGCYAVNILRAISVPSLGEPEVVRARAWTSSSDVDRAAEGTLAFASGAVGRVRCSMFSSWLLDIGVHVVGARGSLHVQNAVLPQLWHRLTLTVDGKTTRERVAGDTTYVHQLRAFRDACLHNGPVLTDAHDGELNQRVIDAIYVKSGLTPRQPSRA